MDKPKCDICGCDMFFKERVESNKPYRIRRFKCIVDGYEKTVFADGTIDDEIEPEKAIKQVNKEFKQQEKNRL